MYSLVSSISSHICSVSRLVSTAGVGDSCGGDTIPEGAGPVGRGVPWTAKRYFTISCRISRGCWDNCCSRMLTTPPAFFEHKGPAHREPQAHGVMQLLPKCRNMFHSFMETALVPLACRQLCHHKHRWHVKLRWDQARFTVFQGLAEHRSSLGLVPLDVHDCAMA